MRARSIRSLLFLLVLAASVGAAEPAPPAAPTLVLQPRGHSAAVNAVLFTPDGRELVSAGQDKVIHIWDTATGELVRSLRGQIGPEYEGVLYAAALSPDGGLLAVGGYGTPNDGEHLGDVRLLDVRSGQVLRVLTGHTKAVLSLAFAPDGKQVASASGDRTVRIWDPASGQCRQVLRGHKGGVRRVAWSSLGRLATAADHTVRICDPETGECRHVLNHDEDVTSVVWSPDGRTVVSGTAGGRIHFWNGEAGTQTGLIPGSDRVMCLAFSPDGQQVAGSLDDGAKSVVKVWSVPGRALVREFPGHSGGVVAVAFAPDGKRIASAGGQANEIYLWEPRPGTASRRLAGTGSTVFAVGWSPDGEQVAWGTGSRFTNRNDRGPLQHSFQLLRAAPGPPVPQVSTWQRAVARRSGQELTAAADQLAVIAREGTRETARIPLNADRDGGVLCFSFTPSGEIIIGAQFNLMLHDAAGRRLREFQGNTGDVMAVAVSADGRYLAAGSADETVRIWPLRTEAALVDPLLSLFQGSDGEWVAWTPEGYYACSPGGERLVGWHVNRGLDKAADYYPAYQFRRRLYRPDVISRLLERGSVAEAVRLADLERKEKTDVAAAGASIERLAPPRVEILAPVDGAVVSQAQVTVQARVTDPNGRKVTTVTLLVNGRKPGERPVAVRPAGTTVWSETASLTPGENTLSLLALNDAGAESVPVNVHVTYRAAEAAVEKPSLYLLSIGVGKYQKPGMDLLFAAKDARDFAAAYRAQEGRLFSKVTAKTLTDAGAGRGEIMDGLDWLSKEVTQRDWAIVFVSGHGVTDNLNQYYFAPHDINPERLRATGVVWSDFRTTLANLPGKVFLVLDTCHSAGAAQERARGSDAYTDVLRDAATDEAGLITFASCMPREISLEDEQWSNGAFTKALVEALGGKADASGDRVVSLSELDAYVAERVKALTGGRQHPTTQRPTSIRSTLPLAAL